MTDLDRYYDGSYPPSLWGGGGGAPDPTITSLNPQTGSASAGSIPVTVTGTLFEAGSVVEIDQVAAPTTFVSATSLTTSFDPSVAGTVRFTVRNPNDEESNGVNFIVTATEEEPEPEPQTGETPDAYEEEETT